MEQPRIGYHSDVLSNLQDCLKRSKVEVRMVDGRVAVARATYQEAAFWVSFDEAHPEAGQTVFWSEVEEVVAEVIGLICKGCGKAVQEQRLPMGYCSRCRS